jgi:hypothetical protein
MVGGKRDAGAAPRGSAPRTWPARGGAAGKAASRSLVTWSALAMLAAALVAALWAARNEAVVRDSWWSRRSTAAKIAAQTQVGLVVGYAPDYRLDHISTQWPIIQPYLTDVILFSVSVKPGGALDLDLLGEERAKTFAANVRASGEAPRVLICVGGGGRSSGFMDAARSPQSRKEFASAVSKLLRAVSADGVDLDWEAPQSRAEVDAYALLIEETKRALGTLLVTVAVHVGQDLGTRAYAAVDRIHLMAYDMVSRSLRCEGPVDKRSKGLRGRRTRRSRWFGCV